MNYIDDFHKKHTLSGKFESPDSSEQPEIPKIIGPYKIEALLEKGGMSLLYLGKHPNTQDLTTIKVLSPRYMSRPDIVQRFLNEAEIIALTDHPNIVKLYGHGEWAGGLYIAMEFIQGTSLRHELLNTPISLKRALEIIIDVAYALCHLHTHGVIHRDLKPENILITEEGQVKVIDFGIAQLLTEKSSADPTSRKQSLIGTPIYMSPEQRENPESVSYPSDLYSLGIIAYELVLGKASHGQIHLSLMPKGLQKILNKTLQPLPKDRYQDVVDFITDLSSYLESTNLDKEKIAGDQTIEFLENFRAAQKVISSVLLPNWEGIKLGLASLKISEFAGIYYDFFSFPDNSYGIIMGESTKKGAEGLICTAMLKGMIQALRHLTTKPAELAMMLNNLIIQSQTNYTYHLSYLILNPTTNILTYLNCGYDNLWQLAHHQEVPLQTNLNNPALGADVHAEFQEISLPWETGDYLILHSFIKHPSEHIADHELPNSIIENALQEKPLSLPQKLVEFISLKIKIAFSRIFKNRSLLLIGILREKKDES